MWTLVHSPLNQTNVVIWKFDKETSKKQTFLCFYSYGHNITWEKYRKISNVNNFFFGLIFASMRPRITKEGLAKRGFLKTFLFTNISVAQK